MNKVVDVEIVQLSLPLPKRVRLGPVELSSRDYVALKVELSNGAQGYAYGYDRGLPLAQLCTAAARCYVGQSADDRNRLRKLAMGQTPAPRAAMTRGVSLCDIALWDAWCVSHSLPLWAVFGGVRHRLPVMPIVGYGMDAESSALEAAMLANDGHVVIKCMIDGADFEADARMVAAIVSALPRGVKLGIDAHWSWSDIDQAMPWCRLAQQFDIAFIEDPFAPTQHRLVKELSSRIDIPLAVGEDVTDLYGFLDLSQAGGILRVDASVSGGITGTLEAISLARAHSRPVLPHVFIGLHSQFGFAYEAVRYCEMMAPSVVADPISDFLVRPAKIERGSVVAPDEPGVGLALAWCKLEPFVVGRESVSP